MSCVRLLRIEILSRSATLAHSEKKKKRKQRKAKIFPFGHKLKIFTSCIPHQVCHGFETSDRMRLNRDFGVSPQNFIDTADLARRLGNWRCGLKVKLLEADWVAALFFPH
jgi:hypothetical protein